MQGSLHVALITEMRGEAGCRWKLSNDMLSETTHKNFLFRIVKMERTANKEGVWKKNL